VEQRDDFGSDNEKWLVHEEQTDWLRANIIMGE